MTLKLSVIGCGYLGATHAACMSSLGFEVIGIDTDQSKVDLLSNGELPFYEPGLDTLLAAEMKTGRLSFTTDFSAVADADVPANLLDSYPELSPAFRQRVQDCSDRNKRVADAIARHRAASVAVAAGASTAPQPPPAAPVPPAATSSADQPVNIQGIFVKTKSHSFPTLSKSRR